MVTCVGSALVPSIHVRELPEFASLKSLDRCGLSRYLLWHGWLPGRPRLVNWPSGLWNSIQALTVLRVFECSLFCGTLMTWLLVWRNTLVSELMGAGTSIPLVGLR